MVQMRQLICPNIITHTLTRCLGQDIDFEVDSGDFDVTCGDKIIISSDGLLNMVEMDDISEVCSSMSPKVWFMN